MRKMYSEKQIEKLIKENSTKLYMHNIQIETDEEEYIEFNVLSTQKEPYQLDCEFYAMDNCISISKDVGSDKWLSLPLEVACAHNEVLTAELQDYGQETTSVSSVGVITTLQDIVSAL